MGWGLIAALAISFIIFYVLFHFIRKLSPLILHGILGLFVFWLLNYLRILSVPIDIVTFLIAAFGGVLGVLTVIILSFLNVPL